MYEIVKYSFCALNMILNISFNAHSLVVISVQYYIILPFQAPSYFTELSPAALAYNCFNLRAISFPNIASPLASIYCHYCLSPHLQSLLSLSPSPPSQFFFLLTYFNSSHDNPRYTIQPILCCIFFFLSRALLPFFYPCPSLTCPASSSSPVSDIHQGGG